MATTPPHDRPAHAEAAGAGDTRRAAAQGLASAPDGPTPDGAVSTGDGER